MAKSATKAITSGEKKTRVPRKTKAPLTTRENLSALIGSARKILRKDKGLNGDVDRLPLLTWVMFLKFLDDLETVHEEEAELDGKRYQPIIEAPYRWRDWAARDDGITGDELLAFISQEAAIRVDGTVGKGLFAYLRGLAGDGEKGSQREVIANVFKGVQNRMVSGYLLRDIINKINGIHFSASEEIHTLSHLYESMLREMRDAAGDSGEFYTPRPVVRFMVQVTDPRLGETVLDPACGTGARLDALAEKTRQVEAHLDAVERDAEHLLALRFRDAIADAPMRQMAEVAPLVRREQTIDLDCSYPELGIRSFGKGTFHKPPLSGSEVGTKRLYRIEPGDLLFSNVFAWEGAIAIAQPADTGRFGSHRFITCRANPELTTAEFLRYYFLTDEGMLKIGDSSPGGAGRNRTLGLDKLMVIAVPMPSLAVQHTFDRLQAEIAALKAKHTAIRQANAALIPATLERVFGVEPTGARQ